MKLVPYDIRKIGPQTYARTDNYYLIMEFVDSDMECAKVENYTQQSAYSCASSLSHSIKRYRIGGVKAISRNGNVFLVKVKD